MTMIDGRQVIPAADLPRRPAGRTDGLVGVVRSSDSLATFPVTDLPTPRAAQAEIDALKAGQSTSAIYKATLAELEATPGTYVGQGGFVPLSGQYSWDGTQWVKIADDLLVNKADRNPTRYGIASAARDAEDAKTQVSVIERMVTQVLHNAVIEPVSNRAVYSASEAVAGLLVNAYRFWMRDVPLLGDITLEIYRRVQAGSTSAYPPTATDTFLTAVTVNGADIADGNTWQAIDIYLPHAVSVSGSDLLVWKLSAAGGLSIGIRNDAPGITQFRRGWFGNAGGASQLIGSPNRLAYEAYYREVASALSPQINALEAQAAIVDRSFLLAFMASASRETNGSNYPQADGHYAWTFGAQAGAGQDIAAGASIDTLALSVELASTVASLRLRVWSRPTNPATAGTYPASDGTATLLYSASKTVAELGLVSASGTWQDLRFPFPAIQTVDGQTYLFELWGYTGAGANVGIGITRAADAGLNQQQRGWYRGSSAIGAGSALAWQLGGDVYRVASDDAGEGSASLLDAYDVHLSVSGLSVFVSGSAYGDGRRAGLNAALSVTAAAAGTETREDYSLIYDTDTVFTSIAGAWIGRRNLGGVSAVRSDTGTPLVLRTDFAYHVNGKVRGLVDTAAYDIDVTYSYKRERYDVIQIDPQTLAVSLKAGVERDFDAIEYRPEPDAGLVPIGYLHVVGNSVNAINAGQFQGGVVREGGEADWQKLLMHNRACLRRVLGKAARGETITVASYGDSITAIQTGNVGYTANGPGRDRPETYLGYVPADTVAALPKYDFGDGAGQVHVKISAPWHLVAALEELSGAGVTHLNFGIGGTNSADTINNGLYPDRLAPMLASGADLLLIHFGMNELGQTATLARVKSIAQQAQAAGMDVAIMSVPRRNSVDGPTLSGWNYTNRALWRAAMESGSAFVPQHWIGRDDQLGGIGAAPESLAMANLINHPGPAEFARYGQVLVHSVLG
ncbi:TPA: SGNH/GDSL hydrolase family protein [Stenotrophomonas maltophilia]|nr:SGNH/GDSL hydrolase family protein [Stenotrophomonas maltophilia]